jgi:hypothetical protein
MTGNNGSQKGWMEYRGQHLVYSKWLFLDFYPVNLLFSGSTVSTCGNSLESNEDLIDSSRCDT